MDGSDDQSFIVEYDGVRYDLDVEKERTAFYTLFDTLSSEEKKKYEHCIYESLDRVTKARGHYGGMPFFRSLEDGEGPEIFGRSRHPQIAEFLASNEYDRPERDDTVEKEIDGETYEIGRVHRSDRFYERHKPRNDLAILWKNGRASKGFRNRNSEIDERLLLIIRTIRHIQCDTVKSAETVAMEKLRELVGEHQYESYRLCGALVTTGRSGMHYIIRRCRPTIAFRLNEGFLVPVRALCSHPMGYYADSYCGVMVPTDEVIAHYLMIQADEHSFWKRSTQHDLADPRSGL